MPRAIREFGTRLGDEKLTNIVLNLYRRALASSSIKSYRSGENHFRKFLAKYPSLSGSPFRMNLPSDLSLTLCFFGASLFQKDSINSASSIRNYVGHAKKMLLQEGCHPDDFESDTLSRVLKGVSKILPKIPDSRPPFLLPLYSIPLIYRYPTSPSLCAEVSAVILGFLAMLRFHVFEKLSLENLILVTNNGVELPLVSLPPKICHDLIYSDYILGFFFNFSDKFHPVARAYFCKLQDLSPRWKYCCPLRVLRLLWTNGLLKDSDSPFSRKLLTPSTLITAMRRFAKNNRDFKTQSLRVGGDTFYITFGLSEDFTNFLGRRAIKKSSQLYFRADARLTIWKLRTFFKSTIFPPANSSSVGHGRTRPKSYNAY